MALKEPLFILRIILLASYFASMAVVNGNPPWFPKLPIAIAPQPSSTGKCLVKVDLVILCDGSNSVITTGKSKTGDQAYYKNYVYTLLKDVIDAFPVADDETHIGLIMFGNLVPETWFHLDTFKSAEKMKKVFDTKSDKGPGFGSTYTGAAMRQGLAEFNKNGRRNVAKVLLLITDGDPSDMAEADNENSLLKRQGITIITMGIGGSVSQSTLLRWATKSEYYMKSGFADLKEHIEQLKKTICKAIEVEAPSATIAPTTQSPTTAPTTQSPTTAPTTQSPTTVRTTLSLTTALTLTSQGPTTALTTTSKPSTTAQTTTKPTAPTTQTTTKPTAPTTPTTAKPTAPTTPTTAKPTVPTSPTPAKLPITTGATQGTKAPTPSVKPPPPAFDPNPPSPKPPAGECTAKVDIVIIIENSGSIERRDNSGNFEKVKLFVVNLMKSFPIGRTTRVAVIEAGNDAVLLGRFEQVNSESAFKTLITGIKYRKQRAFIGKALDLARRDLFAKAACDNNAKLLITISDGYSNDEVKSIAQEIRDLGVKMVGVGFGTDTPFMRATVEALSSDPKDRHAIFVSFDRLLDSAHIISKRACGVAMTVEKQSLPAGFNGRPIKGGLNVSSMSLFIDEINRYRRMHSAPALAWSSELSRQAQRWAEYLAEKKSLIAKPNIRYGQTLYESKTPSFSLALIAVRAWYNQIIYYNFQHPKVTQRNRYFVQLVWRSTTDVGVGSYQDASGKTYVVAFYNPSANSDGAIGGNVLPITNSGISRVKGNCPQGFHANLDHCYKLHSNKGTWLEAVATCSADKGSLVSVTREDEEYFVKKILQTSSVKNTWLGLNSRLNEGSLSWVDGESFSFNGWGSRPQMGGAKKCVQLDTTSGWQLLPCDHKLHFICKTVRPGDLLFTVTIHYPTQPWSDDLAYGTSATATELMQRVEKLIMGIYGKHDWFNSYTIKAFRGSISVFVDLELRFGPAAPIDPLEPLKVKVHTRDCQSFICDITDMKIVPAINGSFSDSCPSSCQFSCSSSCPATCCALSSFSQREPYHVVTVSGNPSQRPPPPQPLVVISGPLQVSTVDHSYPYSCDPSCFHSCSRRCPVHCCGINAKKRTLKKKYHRKSG